LGGQGKVGADGDLTRSTRRGCSRRAVPLKFS
jgi:hypothetical protein